MKRLMKILLGLSIGVGIALLFAPKSGRKLREQLLGGATGKLLPAAPVEFPQPEGERLWDAGTATAVAEPPAVEPAVEEPAIVEEAVVEEVVAEPAIVEEVVAAQEAVVEEVVAEEAVAEATSEDLRPRIEETRAAVETDIAQPFAPVAAEDAVAEEAAVEEVAAEEAVVEEPTAEEAVVEEAVVEEPTAEEAVVEEAVVVEVAAEEALVEGVVADEALVEEAPAREAAAGLVADMTSGSGAAVAEEEPAEAAEEIEAAVAEEPVAGAVEEPVAADAAATREDGTIDQAEMRRRIEETRARLKAKAFDAMMSGESALLSRDSGEKPVPKGDDVKLDGELESTIDESLSQEEY